MAKKRKVRRFLRRLKRAIEQRRVEQVDLVRLSGALQTTTDEAERPTRDQATFQEVANSITERMSQVMGMAAPTLRAGEHIMLPAEADLRNFPISGSRIFTAPASEETLHVEPIDYFQNIQPNAHDSETVYGRSHLTGLRDRLLEYRTPVISDGAPGRGQYVVIVDESQVQEVANDPDWTQYAEITTDTSVTLQPTEVNTELRVEAIDLGRIPTPYRLYDTGQTVPPIDRYPRAYIHQNIYSGGRAEPFDDFGRAEPPQSDPYNGEFVPVNTQHGSIYVARRYWTCPSCGTRFLKTSESGYTVPPSRDSKAMSCYQLPCGCSVNCVAFHVYPKNTDDAEVK